VTSRQTTPGQSSGWWTERCSLLMHRQFQQSLPCQKAGGGLGIIVSLLISPRISADTDRCECWLHDRPLFWQCTPARPASSLQTPPTLLCPRTISPPSQSDVPNGRTQTRTLEALGPAASRFIPSRRCDPTSYILSFWTLVFSMLHRHYRIVLIIYYAMPSQHCPPVQLTGSSNQPIACAARPS
jgi:hypothetical protein